MENQVTSIEQSRRLLEVGVPAEKASMRWGIYRDFGEDRNKCKLLLNKQDVFADYATYIPAFTVADLLGMLPITMTEQGHLCEFSLKRMGDSYGVEYDCYSTNFCVSFLFCNTAIEALEYAVERFAKKRVIAKSRISNEQWIAEYLQGKDYTSPTVIGKAHAMAFNILSLNHHSAWASPICKRMVKKEILIRNEKGQYKLNRQ